MASLGDISIKHKLMGLSMIAVVAAMFLACTAFVINDIHLIKKDSQQQLSVLADVYGSVTSAALTFDDGESAEQFLSSLNLQPMVTKAVLYNQNGEVFATYPAGEPAENAPHLDEGVGYDSKSGHLQVVKFLSSPDGHLGTIYIQGDLAFIRKQLVNYAIIVVIVMSVSFVAAYLLASRLQHIISGPIMELTLTAQNISYTDDFRMRVSKHGNDELGTLCDEFNLMLDTIEQSKHALERAHEDLEARVVDRTRQLSEANEELNKEIAERIRAEEQLEKVHRELIDAARKAGMAEVATGVLHNVGNVLNSVNVSASMLSNGIKTSKVGQLGQVVNLLEQHNEDLGEFITSDEKGKQVPRFLKMLAEHLSADEQSLLEEATSLMTNVEHIKTIITTQQSYATSGGLVEPIDINSLLDDAVRLHSTSFGRHGIELIKDYAFLPEILVDKQRLMQIVINLVKNAKEALKEANEMDRTKSKSLTVRTKIESDRLIIEVSDTGIGIKNEQLDKIFSHGFTTKKTGHGFGLHSCANAATEMDGQLSVTSDGEMQGATFRLELPMLTVKAHVKSQPGDD